MCVNQDNPSASWCTPLQLLYAIGSAALACERRKKHVQIEIKPPQLDEFLDILLEKKMQTDITTCEEQSFLLVVRTSFHMGSLLS